MLVSKSETKDPELLGEEYRVGALLATYPPLISSAQIMIIGALLTGGILLVILAELSLALPLHDVPIGLVFISISLLVCLWGAYRNWSKCMHIYSDGFIYVRRARLQVIRWQDVETVRHRAFHGTRISFDRYNLNCQNGEKLTIDDSFSDMGQIGSTIEIKTAHHLIPLAWDAYQKQQKITFGPLTLILEGIVHNGKLLPWKQVDYINIDSWSGCIKVRACGKSLPWCVVRLGKVPNIEVFRIIVLRIAVEVLRRKITII